MIWVISCDSNHCRIYSYQRKPSSLKLIKETMHPEFRLKRRELLTTDKPGHYQTKDTARGAYSPHTDPKEVEIDNFAHEIAKTLDEGRRKNLFKKFIIIASPHINGVILQHINKKVESLLIQNIKKDYLHMDDRDLLKYLNEDIYDLGIDP